MTGYKALLWAGGMTILAALCIFLGTETAQAEVVPVGHWTLDDPVGSTAVIDSSPNHYDAGQNGSPTLGQPGATPATGTASSFAGGGSYWSAFNTAFNAPSFTFTIWLNPMTGSSLGSPLGTRYDPGNNYGWLMYTNCNIPSPTIEFMAWQQGTPWHNQTLPITPGNWYFVAGSYDAATKIKNFYVTPADSPSLIFPDSKSVTLAMGNPGRINIGARGDGQYSFKGSIDDVQYYNQALSQDDIAWLYANPGQDLSSRIWATTWTGAASSEWSTAVIDLPKNWTAGGNPIDYSEAMSVTFDDTASQAVVNVAWEGVNPGPVTFNNDSLAYQLTGGGIGGAASLFKGGAATLTLENTNTYSGDTTIDAGTLKIGNFAALPSGLGTGNIVLNGTLDLNANSITVNGLSGSGTVTSSAAGAAGLMVGDNQQTSDFSGTIQDGSGVLSLTKTGSGTFALSGPVHDYSGGTVVAAGVLAVVNAAATLGRNFNGNDITVNAGAALVLCDAGNVGSQQKLTVVSSSDGLGSVGVTGNFVPALTDATGSYGGVLGINTTSFDALADLSTLANGVWLLGSNTAGTFSGASLAPGNGGVYRLGGGGGTLTIANAVLTGDHEVVVGSLDTAGAGTVVLAADNDYTGATTVSAGSTLQVGNGGDAGTLGSGPITVEGRLVYGRGDVFTESRVIAGAGSLEQKGPGTLVLLGNNVHTGPTVVNGGVLKIGAADVLPSGEGKGNVVVNSPGVLDMNGLDQTVNGLGGNGQITNMCDPPGTNTLTVGAADTTSTFAGVMQDGTGIVTLRKTGAGTLVLGGSSPSWTGGITVSAGTLQLNTNNNPNVAGSGTITLGDGDSGADEIRLYLPASSGWPGGPSSYLTNPIHVAAGPTGKIVISDIGGGYAAEYRGTITLDNDVTFRADGGDRLGVGSQITGTGNVTIEYGPGGRVTFGPRVSNDFAGSITVNPAAWFQLGDAPGVNPLSAAADLTVNGTMSFTSFTPVSATAAGLNGSGTINIGPGWGSSLSTLTVGASDHDGSFNGTIAANNIALVKIGSGTQTLTGVNNYTGGTTVNGGTLQIGDGGFSGTLPGHVANNATVAFNRADFYEYAGAITGLGSVVQRGEGTLILSGVNGYAGGTTVSAGILQLGNGAALGDSRGPLAVNTGMLDLNGVQAAVGLLSGADGTIESSLPGASLTTTFDADTSTYAGMITDGIGTVALVKGGSGKLVLTGENSYLGGTTVNGGTLEIASAGALPVGGSLTIGAAGTVVLSSELSMAGTATQSVQAVPEPATIALLLAGMAALAMVGWRRK